MKNYDSAQIRSFTLAGHSHSGKTSIADGIAFLTGLNTRLGSSSDGTSLLDFEDEEKERGGSLQSSFLTVEHDGHKIHIIDTPGDGDFIHDAYLTMQGSDACVLVVSAVDGVQTQTEKMNALANELGLPRIVVINKLDRDNIDVDHAVDDVKVLLGLEPVLLHLPIGEGEDFRGVVDLLSHQAWVYDDDSGKGKAVDVPADMVDEVDAATEVLNEAVAASDEELMELYFEEGALTRDQLLAGIAKGWASGTLAPVLFAAAGRNMGVDRLLNLTLSLPSPLGRSFAAKSDSGADVEVLSDPTGPFAALCFKSIIDPFVGHLSVFRCLRGSAGADTVGRNARDHKDERLGTYFHLQGKKTVGVSRVTAGDIFAIAKLKHTFTGDTLTDVKEQVQAEFRSPPEPMISLVIRPKTRADEDKARGALDKLLAEDKGLIQTFDDVTKEIVLSGRGQNHIHVACQKMKRKYGVEVTFGTPTIAYRETISGNADVRYRHRKQTGGAGQFGEVAIRISPNERGAGFMFENKTVGGVIPSSLIPAVEKGVVWMMDKGVLAGFPMVDIKVQLYDGKSHPVDSKDIAFQIAGRQAIKQAVPKARPILLEPIYDVDVTVPEANVGDIMGDLNQRRARVSGMEARGRNTLIRATAPLAEMQTYAPALKSITGGKGTYHMEFKSYDPVPYAMQDKIVEEVSRVTHHDDDH